jgi:asparagine synthase (glutamine-hydrolysing)
MCGILGKISKKVNKQEFKLDLKQLQHRGPDDSGVYFDENISLGHTRLSLLDSTSNGHQPMISRCEDFIIIFNGEIYNFKEIKGKLIQKGYKFSSHTDTEVILYGYIEYREKIVAKLNGMFAFSIYDKKTKKLFLARDRSGIKPLYYFQDNKIFSFSSEIKILKKYSPGVNFDAKILFLLLGYVPEPFTINDKIFMFPAGCYGQYKDGRLEIKKYDEYEYSPKIVKPYSDIVSDVRKLLDASIKRHLISDKPVGVFLSGGIDSSIITSIASQHNPKLQTLSLVFNDKSIDEEYFQNLIVDKYATNHTKVSVDSDTFLNNIDKFMQLMEQPTVDGLNTYFIAKIAKDNGLKSVLSGVGSDEIFYGYPSFKYSKKLYFLSKIPYSIIKIFGNFGKYKKLELLQSEKDLASYLPSRNLFLPSEISDILKISKARVYRLIVDLYENYHYSNIEKIEDKISFYELNIYMKNQLLRDSDLFSMTNSVEVRTPFLDRELVDYVLKIAPRDKFGKYNKNILVDATIDLLPKEVYSRKKSGFVLPYEKWLVNNIDRFPVQKDVLNKFKNGRISWGQFWAVFVLENKFNEKV